jgi:hypothetical protein
LRSGGRLVNPRQKGVADIGEDGAASLVIAARISCVSARQILNWDA